MAGVRIVTDSSCDLDDDEAAELGIEIVPLTIRFGDHEYVDREELTVEEFYRKLSSSAELPETAAPAPGAFEERFRKLASDGADAVVCVNISSGLSATMQSAQAAANALSGEVDVRVVDSRSITRGLGNQVVQAAEAARSGKSADEVVDLLAALGPRTRVYGTLDTLEFLKRGGRIGGAQALLGTMLSIKPIVDLSNGVVEEAGKQRTRKKALLWLKQHLDNEPPVERLNVMHSNAADVGDFVDLIADRFPPADVHVGLIGPVIGTHGGPGLIGIAYQLRA